MTGNVRHRGSEVKSQVGEDTQRSPEHEPGNRRLTVMRRTAVIWLAGCIAWTVDFAANVYKHHAQHAQLALMMAVMFGIAYAFYRTQPR